MEFFEMRLFFLQQNKQLEKFVNLKKIIYRYSEIIGYMHLFPLHNESSLMPVGWKLWEK